MKNYRNNVEIAKEYKVSEKTIRNWIKSAYENKLELELVNEGDKFYIADSASNHIKLLDLSKKGKKFKNKRSLKVIEPTEEFYKVFNEDQIIDLIADLETNKEIDLKHVYFQEGEKSWNDYVVGSLNSKAKNTPKNTIEILNFTKEYILSLVEQHKKINVVDIGTGNGLTIKEFMQYLISQGVVNKYIGIDYSTDVLARVKENFDNWFGGQIEYEFYQRDFTNQTIKDILFLNSQDEAESNLGPGNLILFLGSTIENQRLSNQALKMVKNSMGTKDILVLGQTLDSYTLKNENKLSLDGNEAFIFILNLLNLNENDFELKSFFDEKSNSRFILAELKRDIKLWVKTDNINKYIELSNNDRIILLRHKHHKLVEIVNDLDEIGFDILDITTSIDHSNINIISRLYSGDN